MARDLFLNLVTRNPLLQRQDGVDLLRILLALPPEIRPDRFNNYEPVNRQLDPTNLDDAIEAWHVYPFFWKRSRASWDGAARPNIGPRPTHGWLKMDGESRRTPLDALRQLLRTLAIRYDADFGFMHLLTPREVKTGALADSVSATHVDGSGTFMSIPPILLTKYLPDLYWANVFGPAYLELFGHETVLATPAAVVEPLRDDLVYLQLTPEITDVRDRPEAFETARLAAKQHLGLEAFFDPHLGREHAYRVPDFRLPPRRDSA